jgi:ribosomal protein L35AE/L33A
MKANVKVRSNVEGAEVYYNGSYQGTTPQLVKVSKSGLKSGSVYIEVKSGGETQKFILTRKLMAGYFIIDLLLVETIVPIIVDFASGSIYRADPKRIDAHFETVSEKKPNNINPIIEQKNETKIIDTKTIVVGDNVKFKKTDNGDWLEGKVIKIIQNTATLEYNDKASSKTKEIELDLSKLTKSETLVSEVPEVEKKPEPKTNNTKTLSKGDNVKFRKVDNGDLILGKVVSVNQNMVTIEYIDPLNPNKTREIDIDSDMVIKIETNSDDNNSKTQKENLPLQVGDNVLFKKFDNTPLIKGKITKIILNIATIEYTDPSANNKIKEIELDIKKLTRTDK